ncbi:uncharacterized protein F5891DRAFT_216949 [Suillus fuscotomentosus]|uniref:Uncharacterized protein n=1 Tax=Suillus fuscotomentosus TaxID=1912939 RepID=A0AAD4EKG3_9AGAM|nr:uncharacterized protein F5891DRAFT_216949 [Suillus fuscotomentosus]KAG1907855.1 hypothetical protein F5891DRAFT_216949 [Suillus fuscotomentosus]
MLSLTHKTVAVSIFDQVSRNLASIGCIPLSEYLYGSSSIPAAPLQQETLSTVPKNVPVQHPQPSTPAITKTSVDTVSANAISRLHQTSQRTFGSIEPLKFEFIEEAGQRSKKCILTISRPNGSTRSYATDPVYSRKSDAKSAAATLATEMGALDFITHGDPEELKLKRGLVLASINSSQNQERTQAEFGSTADNVDGNNAIEQIETCCVEWRGGSIAPHWVALLEPKIGHTQGCALRIELSPHVIKVYASDTIYNTYNEAKGACAEAALREGVLDFIKHGNGQLRPASPQLYSAPSSSDINGVSANKQPPSTLQAFYESLPRPFPESFESKDVNEFGAPGYMNTLVQNARGGKLTTTFIFTSDGTPGLHGCFLRLDRPTEYRAYLVDPRFPKRADAKAAVCLQALSQGAGDYMRAIGKAVEERVTPLMKTWVNDQVYPVLLSEYNKLRGRHPNFTYEKEKDAFGCTMTLQLSADPTPDQTRIWTVSNDYRNKADAKVAVVCIAIEQRAMEFIRFRGEPPPPGYTTPYSLQTFDPGSSQKSNGKRKMVEDAHSQGEHEKPTKRQKKAKLESTATKHGNKKAKGSTLIHSIPESGTIRAGQPSRKGYASAPYRPGLEDESGFGTAYRLPQVSLNPIPPNSDQRFMPLRPHSSVQGDYGYPLSAQSFAGASGTSSGGGAGAERLGDLSEPEPGEVV